MDLFLESSVYMVSVWSCQNRFHTFSLQDLTSLEPTGRRNSIYIIKRSERICKREPFTWCWGKRCLLINHQQENISLCAVTHQSPLIQLRFQVVTLKTSGYISTKLGQICWFGGISGSCIKTAALACPQEVWWEMFLPLLFLAQYQSKEVLQICHYPPPPPPSTDLLYFFSQANVTAELVTHQTLKLTAKNLKATQITDKFKSWGLVSTVRNWYYVRRVEWRRPFKKLNQDQHTDISLQNAFTPWQALSNIQHYYIYLS